MSSNRLLFVSLNNDLTGSCYVLKKVISHVSNHEIIKTHSTIIAPFSLSGYLSDLANTTHLCCKFIRLPAIRNSLARYSIYQFIAAFYILKSASNVDLVYINTTYNILPVLVCWLISKRYILHAHEKPKNKLFSSLLFLASKGNTNTILSPSSFLSAHLSRSSLHSICIGNPYEDYSNIKDDSTIHPTFNVGMACSPRKYKGVDTFLELAQYYSSIPNSCIHFFLYLSSTDSCYTDAIENLALPNLTVAYEMNGIQMLLKQADLLLNLSSPNLWQETYALTLAEALSAGVPVIAPHIGGHIDYVKDRVNGFLIDTTNLSQLISKLDYIKNNYFSRQCCLFEYPLSKPSQSRFYNKLEAIVSAHLSE